MLVLLSWLGGLLCSLLVVLLLVWACLTVIRRL